MSENKKITFKRKRPNPLFQEWLEELYEEAKTKKSKLETMLKEALLSVSKYPLPLQTGSECAVLKGFDKRLCIFLDKRLEVHNSNAEILIQGSNSEENIIENKHVRQVSNILENKQGANSDLVKNSHSNNNSENIEFKNGIDDQNDTTTLGTENNSNKIQTEASSSSSSINNSQTDNDSKRNKTKKKPRVYKPSYRSGSYAILVALLENIENSGKPLTKEVLIENAQKYCEESFIRPKPESYYTAWSNMTTLINKGLVNKLKNGRKLAFELSDSGVTLAKEIKIEYSNIPSVNDLIFNIEDDNEQEVIIQSSCESETPLIDNDLIVMEAGSFEVILLIDKNETGGVSKKNDPTVAQFNKYPDLKHEYRSLKVGDFTWIARQKNNNQELVLPYIIERKRMDDLGASIKDGRFHEQKFRLRKCGLKNVIYMVENYGSNIHIGLPLQSLMQAMSNTRVQDGFKVHMTNSLSNSARFLAMMTKRLTINYKDKRLIGYDRDSENELMTFHYFNTSSAKTKPLTVTEVFIKLLLQLKGLSVEKAIAITDVYSTPRLLIDYYQKCETKKGEFLLADLTYGDLNRKVGPVASKSVYQLFSRTF